MMRESKPSWDQLYEVAAGQAGHFTTAQADQAGYSSPLLAKYLGKRRVRRVRRGVYRLVHFPAGEHEDLVVLWLWSDRSGVFSHETALALHELSDVLPAQVNMTLPESWRVRRIRIPTNVIPHFADVPDDGRVFSGDVPVTTASRTLRDCIEANVSAGLVRQGIAQGLRRGLFARGEARTIERALSRRERATA